MTPTLLARWRGWLAPDRQPLFLNVADAGRLGLSTVPRAGLNLTHEEGDTHTVWAVPGDVDRAVWVTRATWAGWPAGTRRAALRLQVRYGRGNVPLGRHYADLVPGLPAGRFLWLPEHLTPEVLARVVARGAAACQRADVPEAVWAAAQAALPRVRALAGTFSQGKGNCFGAVMGAAGLGSPALQGTWPEGLGPEETWMGREPFEAFVQGHRQGGHDDRPGTLLVWRSARGAEHAAVTLGGGWAFHKPAQTWWTPRVVLPVRALIQGYRTPGHRLTRYTRV